MKIIKLTAENIKKLRAVEITPAGDLVEITGRNGAGKSSVLDSLWWALAGTKHIQAVPIRKGATKARIRLDLGELVVERRFTPAGSILTVENADGARYTSPQTMLDALLGALTFDPLAFVGQAPREQFDTLRGLVPLDVDVDELDGLNRRDFDRRTEINREAKALRAQADGLAAVPDALPEAPLDTDALMDRMASASKTNAEIETRRGRREQLAREAAALLDRAATAKAEAERLRTEADRLARENDELRARAGILEEKLRTAEPLPEPVNVDAVRAELDSAQAINRQIEARARKHALIAKVQELDVQSRELTETMDARSQAKADAIAKAPMPVAGLGFGDGLVTFEGLPFDQAATAEQLRVSVAIAMAANPKLRVLRIKEGSLLDQDNVALIAEMAREHDYQVWLETVNSGGRPAVVIEDGQVVTANGRSSGGV